MATREERLTIGRRRLISVLRTHTVATLRTLEQKIADAGPPDLRVDPHILTKAKEQLGQRIIVTGHWYHLAETPAEAVTKRIAELAPIHNAICSKSLTDRIGEASEIAVYRALRAQQALEYLGAFLDLDAHDDCTRYTREDPPSAMSGRQIPGKRKLDFIVGNKQCGWAGIEIKNAREWYYPQRNEIRMMLLKCCHLKIVPVMIARRIHFSTKLVFEQCGVVFWETYRQRYPNCDKELAAKAKHKDLLGYHDIIVGNEPDPFLIRFIHDDLPGEIERAQDRFAKYQPILMDYATVAMPYRDLRLSLGIGQDEF